MSLALMSLILLGGLVLLLALGVEIAPAMGIVAGLVKLQKRQELGGQFKFGGWRNQIGFTIGSDGTVSVLVSGESQPQQVGLVEGPANSPP